MADPGWLSVTSQRIVFSGHSQVVEFPLRRLVGIMAWAPHNPLPRFSVDGVEPGKPD